jgi:hypothetical protein
MLMYICFMDLSFPLEPPCNILEVPFALLNFKKTNRIVLAFPVVFQSLKIS